MTANRKTNEKKEEQKIFQYFHLTVCCVNFWPPSPKNGVTLDDNHFALECCQTLMCSHLGHIWAAISTQ